MSNQEIFQSILEGYIDSYRDHLDKKEVLCTTSRNTVDYLLEEYGIWWENLELQDVVFSAGTPPCGNHMAFGCVGREEDVLSEDGNIYIVNANTGTPNSYVNSNGGFTMILAVSDIMSKNATEEDNVVVDVNETVVLI